MNINRFNKKSLILPVLFFIIGCVLCLLSFFQQSVPPGMTQVALHTAVDVGVVIAIWSLAFIIYKLVTFLFLQYEQKLIASNHYIIAIIFSILRQGIKILFVLLAIQVIVIVLGFSTIYLDMANKLIDAILIAALGWISLQIVKAIERVYYQHAMAATGDALLKSQAKYTRIQVFKNIIASVIVIITIAAILMLFDSVRQLGVSLLASAGLLTAIAGLASQKALGSMFAGFQIAMTQPIKLGDTVVVENEFGTIEQITLTYVVVKLWDLRRIVVPIGYFLEKPFQNWTRDGNNLIGTVYLYVDYSMPIQPLRELLNQIVQTSPLSDKKTCSLQVYDFRDNCIEIRILISADHPDNLSKLRNEVREQFLAYMQQHYPDSFPRQRVLNLNSSH